MRRFGVLAILAALALAACSKSEKPEPMLMTPDSRLLYHDQSGNAIWTICSRGDRVYMSHSGLYQVVPKGCPDGQP